MRTVTWNVRRGLGRDGRVDLERVARVLEPLEADVIALQELDRGRARTSRVDQPGWFAQRLGMHASFFEAVQDGDGGGYGHALLTRTPPTRQRCIPLPRVPLREPRGAIDLEVDHEGTPVRVMSVHLGLLELERRLQIRPLLNAAAAETRPLVLLGDLNAGPRRGTMRALLRCFEDASANARGGTWHSALPIRRLDYALVREWRGERAEVLRGGDASLASDHLPLVADLRR